MQIEIYLSFSCLFTAEVPTSISENRPFKLYSQALEVMAINHKNNASNKCLHRGLHCNTKYCQVCKPRFRSHFVVAFPARFLESEQMLHGNLKRSIANQNGFNQLLPDTFLSV